MQHVDPMAPRPHSKGVEDDQPGAESRSVPSLRRMSTQSSLPCSDAGAGLLVFVTHATWERPVPFDIPVMSTVKYLTHQVSKRLHAVPGTVRLFMAGKKLDAGSCLSDLGVCPQSVLTATSGFDVRALGEVIGSEEDAKSLLLDMKNPQHVPTVTASMRNVRKTLSRERDPPVAQIIESGVVPVLVEAIRQGADKGLQFEAAWCLTNICSGESDHCMHVVDAGAVPRFVMQLQCGHVDIVEQAVWALSNIAGDSVHLRDVVLRAGAMGHVVEAVEQHSGRLSLLRNAMWSVSNLVRGKPKPETDDLHIAIACALRYADHSDSEVQIDALWSLAYATECEEGADLCIDEMRGAQKGLHTFAHYLQPTQQQRMPVLRWLGSFASGRPDQTQVVVESDVLTSLEGLTRDSKQSVRKEVFWTLSNVAAGTPAQQTYLLGLPYLPPALLAAVQESTTVAEEASYVIANLTAQSLTPENAAWIAGWDAFEYLRSELVSRLQLGWCSAPKKMLLAADAVLSVSEALKNTQHPHAASLKEAVDLMAEHCDDTFRQRAEALQQL
eukprot:TRINITY_DN563_c0_g5_i1.p1 TRINITY_DN563_c0_g5~~TRINITY_DN563_c0_g5_i1.p1  ORF type:complete len:555 (+),score=65.96 TRINITY_DN563_c0_g5_i1:64-1728(+)